VARKRRGGTAPGATKTRVLPRAVAVAVVVVEVVVEVDAVAFTSIS
jgi:hypothetical protein